MDLEPLAESILKFWFTTISTDGKVAAEVSDRWFKKDLEFDRLIDRKYGSYMEAASWGAFDRWSLHPDGLTALIILLDQFPRNLFRNQAKSFYFDSKALAFAKHSLEQETVLKVPTLMGYFQLMPFMHSESLEDQTDGLHAFEELHQASQPGAKNMIASAIKFSHAHRDIIEKFGRFPHRNQSLGRSSTDAELAFLKTPGSSF